MNSEGSVLAAVSAKTGGVSCAIMRFLSLFTTLDTRVVVALAGLAVMWGLICWAGAASVVHERVSGSETRGREAAKVAATLVAANVGTTLAYVKGIPWALAQQAEIEQALALMGPSVRATPLPPSQFRAELTARPEWLRVKERLALLLPELDVEQIVILNAAGDCVASAGYADDISPVGFNFSDREYFKEAMQRATGRQFAFGRTSSMPGILYAAPVLAERRVVGVVALKIDIARLTHLVSDRDTIVSDENGVILVAGDPEFLLKALPGSRAAQGRVPQSVVRHRYNSEAIQVLLAEPTSYLGVRLVRLENRPFATLEALAENHPDNLLEVRVYRDASELRRIDDEGRWTFVLLFLAGISVAVCVLETVLYIRNLTAHETEIARVNAELLNLNEELQIQARFDALTACANRRYVLEILDVELQRSLRFGFACTIAMLDIDHFKAVNDQYGHATGDAVLRHFVGTVTAALRVTDTLGRVGGEEFLLLMPQTEGAGALELAERIRQAVERQTVATESGEWPLTVSIGVAQWRGAGDTPEGVIARADDALYAAKHAGRNRVLVERPLETEIF